MERNFDLMLVNKACVTLGKMLDFAVHSLRQNADAYFVLFITSGFARVMENMDIRCIAGMSGIEMSYKVLDKCGVAYTRVTPRHTAGLSREYYAGYALAKVHVETGLTYEQITAVMPVSSIISMYGNYHNRAMNELPWQMSDEDRLDAVDKIKAAFPGELLKSARDAIGSQAGSGAKKETRLKELRLLNGLSQSRLAKASGVPLRTLQQYEQRQKDLAKANFEYIMRLSSVLNCEPADLLDH